MNKKKYLVRVGLLCVGLQLPLLSMQAFAECVPKSQFSTVNKGVLTVSTASVPPFSYVDDAGNFQGMDSKVVKRLASDNCLELKVVVVDMAAAIQYVVANRSDISSGAWYRTTERAKVMGISDPLFLEPISIYSKEGYTKFSDLVGKRVGTVQGFAWVGSLKSLYKDDLRLYPNAVALLQDLSAGRLDAAFNSLAIGIEAQRQGAISKDYKILMAEPDARVPTSTNPTQTSIIYNKSNESLGKALNTAISESRSDGTLTNTLREYGIPVEAGNVGEPKLL